MAEGYDYLYDCNTEKRLAIDKETGEALKSLLIEVPEGTFYVTPQQQRENAQKKERTNKKRLERKVTDETLGKYYFCGMYEKFKDLSPETLTKLIFLCTL